MDMKLSLEDLLPTEATLELSKFPGKVLVLAAFSLGKQIWLKKRFGGEEGIKKVFNSKSVTELAEVAFFLIKDKSDFKERRGETPPPNCLFKSDFEDFLDFANCVLTVADQKNLLTALTTTIGVSQPMLEDLAKKIDPETLETTEKSNTPPNESAPQA